jgi:hypothetical protein
MAEATIETLQSRLEYRANKRLKKAIEEAFSNLNQLLSQTRRPVQFVFPPDQSTFYIHELQTIMRVKLEEELGPVYQEEEAKQFLARVDKMHAEIESIRTGSESEEF